jgi:16S rRNA G966 N2-methylase RsmD
MELAKRVRGITKQEAVASYQTLCETSVGPKGENMRSRAGLDALDYYFLGHRLKAKTKRHLSFYDAMRDPDLVEKLTELVVRYKKKPLSDYDETGLLKAQYQVFQLYYGTINQFRPVVARWIYQRFSPRVGILDISAGWGGRALAAMSMGIPYIGVDANTKLKPAYEHLKELEPGAKVRMIFRPSEEVSFENLSYDLVFTSPPYFMLEEYEKMPAYGSKQGFIDRFLIPVVKKAWAHLLPGYMVLNMPEEMYEAVRPHLPKIKERLALPLSNRHPVNTAKGQRLGEEDKERHEWMYVWWRRSVPTPLSRKKPRSSKAKTQSSKAKTLKKRR